MAMSSVLENCLRSKGSAYDVLQHSHSYNSMSTAEAAHIPGDRLAKTVVLQDDTGSYAAAVLPSTCHVSLSGLREMTGHDYALAEEEEVRELFKDCEQGAVPPVAMAYGMQTFLDESLAQVPEVYFEAGDHEALIHMRTEQFLDLMEEATRVRCAQRI